MIFNSKEVLLCPLKEMVNDSVVETNGLYCRLGCPHRIKILGDEEVPIIICREEN